MEEGYPIDVIQSYELYQHIKYMNLASLCILICEWFNTLEVEAAVIRGAKWGFGSVIYTFSRLLPFFDVPLAIFYRLYPRVPTLPNNVCSVLYKIETWSTVFGILASEIILVMMIYCLANKNRRVGSWLSVQVVAFAVSACVLWGILLESLQFGKPTLPLPTGCSVTGGKYLFAGIGFVLLALNEFILMVFVLGVGFHRYRNSNSTLVKTLYRDGIFYYVFLFLISMGQVIVILAGPVRLTLLSM
ncbi:hypothetical protein BKA70DRAFT_795244 [Coprinopsis sp. MPI-PUGE-AT-0042]|nr:hypothetical protein BKA70DRAFT_795244 [Coprinopsis sp. MPI-PUGE-AT-0042]